MATDTKPLHIACILFPGFQLLDVCGKSHDQPMKLSMLASSMDPVSTFTKVAANENHQSLSPTHTFSSPPSEPIDVLFVPGGFGCRADLTEAEEFLKARFETARTGILDGKKATSNKKSFEWVKTQGPKVEWIRKARWVADGRCWTSSGVAAGMDMTLGWVKHVYGENVAKQTANFIEYEWNEDSEKDRFADLYL
ncbi:BZ3500_MvSof-1268-A1-R1_Chr2-3g05280 [Microbotryum saponariae]|uniref:BZ3500_MvSof-1268-A1-R1_Chr2-3g05280 protein n=1 Tax=Microbotryum saponariae TaxID=289078 RepID=A0A2X0K4Z1_9BASI|nr:BZ3500_MvSof-1268-A1-R1_Chr2-3g05280 [Microbotryum saponariae]SDA01107.1 BZ3501_MvSof-1269-A2-R1_Chr2-2g04953 [Microbotryum saponariae]